MAEIDLPHMLIDHICINLLVASALKINIEKPGNQVNYLGVLNHPINFAGYLFFSILIFCTQVYNQQLMQIWSIGIPIIITYLSRVSI